MGTQDPNNIPVNRYSLGTLPPSPSSFLPALEWLLQTHLAPVTWMGSSPTSTAPPCPLSLPSWPIPAPLPRFCPCSHLHPFPSRCALFPLWAPTQVQPAGLSLLWGAAPQCHPVSFLRSRNKKATDIHCIHCTPGTLPFLAAPFNRHFYKPHGTHEETEPQRG